MWFMSNLQTSIYGIAPVVNATEVNAFSLTSMCII